MSAEQLTQARADLESLDADTPTLESNMAAQTAELDRLRREARAGRADFAQVVEQQTRSDAAAGMLQQHLEDVAAQRGLVEELEAAALEAGAVGELKAAWAAVVKTDQDFARISEALEGRLKVELARLSDLAAQHRQAQADVSRLMRDAATRESGLDARTVVAHLGQRSGRPADRETLDAQAQAITHALEAFAELAAPDEGAAVVTLVRRIAYTGAPGLLPDGLPLLSRVWEAHAAR